MKVLRVIDQGKLMEVTHEGRVFIDWALSEFSKAEGNSNVILSTSSLRKECISYLRPKRRNATRVDHATTSSFGENGLKSVWAVRGVKAIGNGIIRTSSGTKHSGRGSSPQPGRTISPLNILPRARQPPVEER